MSERFDLIVIGGGSAAREAAKKAARVHGARLALIEK
jgi:pyruvate/2-oxoglutarate dehydrogenase complex dihydrolipoamide dehydrogenase (E3) component